MPALLHYAYKYADEPKRAMLAQTNAGGENVARGALIGALMGAAHGSSAFPDHLVEGLLVREEVQAETEELLAMMMRNAKAATEL